MYLLLMDEWVLAGTLLDEKKSNLLVCGEMCILLCMGRISGVFPENSSLKTFGLCTRRERGYHRLCQVAQVLF